MGCPNSLINIPSGPITQMLNSLINIQKWPKSQPIDQVSQIIQCHNQYSPAHEQVSLLPNISIANQYLNQYLTSFCNRVPDIPPALAIGFPISQVTQPIFKPISQVAQPISQLIFHNTYTIHHIPVAKLTKYHNQHPKYAKLRNS